MILNRHLELNRLPQPCTELSPSVFLFLFSFQHPHTTPLTVPYSVAAISNDPSVFHRSSCGTPQARSASGSPWCSTTTATCTLWSLSMMSPMLPASAACLPGSRSASSMLWGQKYPGSWLETSVTSKTQSRWAQMWRSSLQMLTPCLYLRRPLKTQTAKEMEATVLETVTTLRLFS